MCAPAGRMGFAYASVLNRFNITNLDFVRVAIMLIYRLSRSVMLKEMYFVEKSSEIHIVF